MQCGAIVCRITFHAAGTAPTKRQTQGEHMAAATAARTARLVPLVHGCVSLCNCGRCAGRGRVGIDRCAPSQLSSSVEKTAFNRVVHDFENGSTMQLVQPPSLPTLCVHARTVATLAA
jgi:hypothetical protein